MARTLYLSRTGLLEPLGQSQIMSYLRGLSAEHEITLITCEKPADLADTANMARAAADCAAHGIIWHPLRFHNKPKGIAQIWTMFRMFTLGLRVTRRDDLRMIHARSYLPAAVARWIWKLTGTPFVFDMRALWLEEMITAGRLKRAGMMHRALIRLERVCLRDAACVVTQTHASVGHLRQLYPIDIAGQDIQVISTCTDLDAFSPGDPPQDPAIYSCIGSVLSGWFNIDGLNRVFASVAARDPNCTIELITRDDPDAVRRALPDVPPDRLVLRTLPYSEMPDAIQRHRASVILYAGGQRSELGRAPTRLGELLGCGVPVLANSGVGDVEAHLNNNRVGIVLGDPTDPDKIEEALNALEELLSDPDLAARCRATAEAVFSLKKGTQHYFDIYASVLTPDQKAGS